MVKNLACLFELRSIPQRFLLICFEKFHSTEINLAAKFKMFHSIEQQIHELFHSINEKSPFFHIRIIPLSFHITPSLKLKQFLLFLLESYKCDCVYRLQCSDYFLREIIL